MLKSKLKDVKIEPLSEKTLKGSLKLLDKVFGRNKKDKERYHNAFPGSLDMKNYVLLNNKKEKPDYLQYYIAIDKKSKKVIGTTGLYSYPEYKDKKLGLGWYCIDPKFRGKGIGSFLLDFTIQKAREKQKKILELWTTKNPKEEKAHLIYKNKGFKIVKREKWPDEKYEIIYMQLKL
ncbi:MAG: GNAT family N-acetyltransferase [Nanoarchaeota archaeon]